MSNPRNRLGDETSPYLLQHAANPVHWYPWGAAAFDAARAADKPVLLSIGYSACHWCHVMAHESFENEQIAALMNRMYVNIKVDREERPDIDKIYQTAHQLLAQRGGGWPLTVFIDPHDQLPFFAGTYFPPAPRHGMPAFPDVLQRVAQFYSEQRAEIDAQKAALRDVFSRIDATDSRDGSLGDAPVGAIRSELERHFDPRAGGFGAAPKFPHPASVELLIRHWAATRHLAEDRRALHMAVFTLQNMIHGGIYDQLGGGFYRYSTDAQWMIPHFEKMLYDNGALLAACAAAARTGQAQPFQRATRETAGWLMREMQAPQGGFYAALDADSEGIEGQFYAWTPEQAREVLGERLYSTVAVCLGLDQPPNFEHRHHLYLAPDSGVDRATLDTAREKLLAAREQRKRPGRDEKILTSWNALAIRGMAIASRLLDQPTWAESATRSLDFLRQQLWQEKRLSATYKDGRARFSAYLDDYAHLADAIVELLQCRWRTADLLWATELADALLEHFEDRSSGGFYFTANDHEALFHRSRSFSDDATPAGNATATRALLRLGYLLGENRYIDAAERALRAAWQSMQQAPSAHATMIMALDEFIEPPEIVVLRGTPQRLAEKQGVLHSEFVPQRLVFAIPIDTPDLPAALAIREPRGDLVQYVCRGHTCNIID